MLFRPDSRDFRLIGLYLGRVLFGVGLVMLVPLTLALALREWSDAAGFTIGAALAIAVGRGAELALFTREPLTTSRGVATVALSWFVAPVFAAVPLLLSGHWPTWLDAYFEAVSGLTATGLTVTNDLDHLSYSVNLWRHLMQFLGGQGIAIVVLTIFSSGASQVASLYTGEGREEKILPNVVRTVQFIWRVALVYAVIGTGLLVVALLAAGLVPTQALYHAVNVFMAAFDTGGFTPQSTSLAFYHSPIVEAVVMVLMVAGTFSFALHYQLWQGRQRDVARNLELRTMLPSILGLFALAAVGLVRAGTFTDTDLVFRHGFFQMLSAHTTTGFATVPAAHLASDWGAIAPGMMVVAMAIGGMAGSTSGASRRCASGCSPRVCGVRSAGSCCPPTRSCRRPTSSCRHARCRRRRSGTRRPCSSCTCCCTCWGGSRACSTATSWTSRCSRAPQPRPTVASP